MRGCEHGFRNYEPENMQSVFYRLKAQQQISHVIVSTMSQCQVCIQGQEIALASENDKDSMGVFFQNFSSPGLFACSMFLMAETPIEMPVLSETFMCCAAHGSKSSVIIKLFIQALHTTSCIMLSYMYCRKLNCPSWTRKDLRRKNFPFKVKITREIHHK